MRVRVSADPDPKVFMEERVEVAERAVTRSMHQVSTRLKNDWRSDVRGAGLGRRLAMTVRGAAYPQTGYSFRPAALVWTKAPEILSAHDKGEVIRSKDGFYLAIPTDAAGAGRSNRRMTPLLWERRHGVPLRFVYRRGRPSLLVAETRLTKRGRAVRSRSKTGRGLATVPIFVLLPQVQLRKVLQLDRRAREAHAALPGMIIDNWGE